jgi:hypothetical protein
MWICCGLLWCIA